MKTLGIVGWIGPESTIDYYRSIIQMWRDETKDGSAPSVIVNSIDLKKMLDLVAAGSLAEVTEYLSREMERLAKAGADIGLLAANTLHIVFDEVQRGSSIPWTICILSPNTTIIISREYGNSSTPPGRREQSLRDLEVTRACAGIANESPPNFFSRPIGS